MLVSPAAFLAAYFFIQASQLFPAAVSRPARLLGVADSVSLVPGSDANFFVLNDEFELARRVTPDEIIDL